MYVTVCEIFFAYVVRARCYFAAYIQELSLCRGKFNFRLSPLSFHPYDLLNDEANVIRNRQSARIEFLLRWLGWSISSSTVQKYARKSTRKMPQARPVKVQVGTSHV